MACPAGSVNAFAFALVLLAPAAGHAADPAPILKAECCCCEKSAERKMKCCDEMKHGDKTTDGNQAGYDMSDMA